MKKKMGLFLFAFALVTTALVSTPAVAGPSLLCPPGAFSCYIGPVCCADQHCAAFCEDKGGNPHCSGNASEKGCCSCGVEEIEG